MVDTNALSNAGGALDIFTREVRGAANAGVAMAGELLNANQSLSAYTSALSANSGILGNFGKVINGLTKFAEESLAEYQTLSGIGATFGKEMSNIKISAAQLGLSVKDMTDLFMRNSDALRTFGGTTDVAISSFTRLSKSFLDSNFGTELRRMGYTAADINETLLVYNELAQQDGLNRTRSTQAQTQSARDFAVELDGLAKLTGKQRKELADEMKARRREGDVQAFLMGQSAEAQEAFMTATQKIKETMGPQFEALFQDLMIRGAPITEDTRNAFIALGGSADEFEASVSAFRQGMQTNNFDAFNDSLTGAQGAFLDNLKTDEARTMAMQSGLSGVADAMAQAYESSYNFANAVDASAEGQESAQETIQKLQQQISEEQLTQMQTTGGLLDKTIQMQEALREFTIAATTEVLPRLEAMAVRGIDMFLERLPSAEQLAQQLSSGVNQLFTNLDERLSGPYNGSVDLRTTPTAGDNQITESVREMGGDVDAAIAENAAAAEERDRELAQSVVDAETNLREAQDEFAAARAEAEAELQRAQADLLRADSENAAEVGARVTEAQTALDSVVQQGNERILSAMNSLNRAAAMMRSPALPTTVTGATDWRYAPRRAKGGKIDTDEVALVGESGAEFVAGPAEVMGARESMNVMQNLFKGIKALDQSVQTQAQSTANTVSNSNNNKSMEAKYDTMIGLLSELLNVEVSASTTAQRTYRATKGLQGNMIRGLGV